MGAGFEDEETQLGEDDLLIERSGIKIVLNPQFHVAAHIRHSCKSNCYIDK